MYERLFKAEFSNSRVPYFKTMNETEDYDDMRLMLCVQIIRHINLNDMAE